MEIEIMKRGINRKAKLKPLELKTPENGDWNFFPQLNILAVVIGLELKTPENGDWNARSAIPTELEKDVRIEDSWKWRLKLI